MPGLPPLLQPKWKLFVRHHARLTTDPDPARAEEKFQQRIRRSRRVGMVRTMFFAALYFSFIAAATSFVLDYFNVAAGVVLAVLQTVLSSLTVVFIAGIFVCTRLLNYLEVELYYYSAEARMNAPSP